MMPSLWTAPASYGSIGWASMGAELRAIGNSLQLLITRMSCQLLSATSFSPAELLVLSTHIRDLIYGGSSGLGYYEP